LLQQVLGQARLQEVGVAARVDGRFSTAALDVPGTGDDRNARCAPVLCRFIARIAAQPSSIGIDKSITITSGREATAMRTPMAPLLATRTRRPWVLRYVEYNSRVAAWSSTTRTSGAVLRVLARVMFHEVYMRASSPSMRRRHQ